MAWQPVDDQRRTLRGQPQVEVAGSIEAAAGHAVTTFVTRGLVGEHVIYDHVIAR
jgi:hypothetical protein